MQTMSRVVRFHTLGGPEILKIESRAVPDPGVDEVLIKVEAIGLNRADVLPLRKNHWVRQGCLDCLNYSRT